MRVSAEAAPQYEVRELGGQLRYQGSEETMARTIYAKYAGLGTPVTLTEVRVLERSAAYVEQVKALKGAVPWFQS